MMQVWKTIPDWLARRDAIAGGSIGFVPTMGALHRGHASLVERCRRECDVTAVSIFVNPTQFNDPRDLERYPNTLDADLALLESLGVDDVFVPTSAAMYPHGYALKLEAHGLAPCMEALHRPGFFEGVMTVVLKLFNLVRAHRAYFGEKDYQQLKVIEWMVQELFLPVEIVPCATVREASGLAESSRNRLLSPEARQHAAAIYRLLSTSATTDRARTALSEAGFTVDYVEQHWDRRFAAVFLEGVRLIDNVPVPAA